METYNAFLDLTLGFGSPALGFLTGRDGLGTVFIASAVAAVLTIPNALRLLFAPATSTVVENVGQIKG